MFFTEGEPEHWPGHEIKPGNMDAKTRGDRYWCKKNAVATLSLAQRVGTLIGQVQLQGAGTAPAADGDPDAAAADSLDAEVKAAEKEAEKLMAELQGGAKKRAFDRKVHGSS